MPLSGRDWPVRNRGYINTGFSAVYTHNTVVLLRFNTATFIRFLTFENYKLANFAFITYNTVSDLFLVQFVILFVSDIIPKVQLDLFGIISISSKMPSARRKRLLARRSREEGFSSEDVNSNVVLGNQNQTFTSNLPEQNVNDENFPNSVSSVSIHEIRPNEPLRGMTSDENRIREIIRAETEN